MLPLPGAKIRFIYVKMVASDTRDKQNGGDMNEREFWYRQRQLKMWLSV
jgi:hypothetical protein